MVYQFHHLFVPITFLFFLFPVTESDLAADGATLLLLRSAVGGCTLRWNVSNPSPCSWKGVYCNDNATAVTQLRLPGCHLSGEIPSDSIGKLANLRYLSLRKNSLYGPLPSDLSSSTQLQSLFLQENNFSGQIPATLFSLTNLIRLNLAGNSFSGEISMDFNNLTMLKTLELESNNLTGSIPDMNNLSGLREFNVSYNQLNCSIPSSLSRFSNDSFLGNTLCGFPLAACPRNDWNGGGKKLSTGTIVGIVVGSVFGLILVLLALFFLLRKRSPPKSPRRWRQAEMYLPPPPGKPPVLDLEVNSPEPLIVTEDGVNGLHRGRDDGLAFFGEGNVVFSLEELLRAPAEVLGKGTFGSTYKAYLEGETEEVVVVVVVKRLRDVCVSEREFRDKIEDLGMLVHENLVPFRAYYYGREEKLIVFDCMPMGSLSALLHANTGDYGAALTWEIRTKIAFGAARGIEYLHSLGFNVSHGNIKSSNILLTDFYAASVSEYGICQLVSPIFTLDHQNGYRAPEVTDTRKISQKADVYSFGVLLLELATGKAPNDGVLDEEGVDLVRWVRSMSRENQTTDVFDPELLRHDRNNNEEQMVQLLRVGIHCTSRHPEKRPTMVEVTREIRKVL